MFVHHQALWPRLPPRSTWQGSGSYTRDDAMIGREATETWTLPYQEHHVLRDPINGLGILCSNGEGRNTGHPPQFMSALSGEVMTDLRRRDPVKSCGEGEERMASRKETADVTSGLKEVGTKPRGMGEEKGRVVGNLVFAMAGRGGRGGGQGSERSES